ncbi:MAG: hypothetical protein CMJ24_04190 [Phycisphaerae bacterium]|nr:hypothetical protein [Phycisphaerae bacterium]MDG1898567.1 TVP38/TMEM64 family protein [Phycisphaerales bacterium]|tara:strand:- start:76 stop:861 length:786 start_codon:yes stop_codon:yes gene_type:complete
MLLRHIHLREAARADDEARKPATHAIRRALVRCGIGAAVLAVLYLLIHFLIPYMPDLREWVKSLGFWGPLVYCIIFIVLTAVFFPESVIAIAAGTLFGFWMGIVWVVVAGTIGATLIFLVGRTVFYRPVRRRLEQHPKLMAFDKAAGKEGFKLMLLLRLCPLNYSLLCYVLSVSSAKFRPYVLACIGMFPGNISTVYFGFTARHVTEVAGGASTDWVKEVSIYVGLGFAILASAVVARIAMRSVKKMQDEPAESTQTVPQS